MPRFTPDVVRDILESHASGKELAVKHHCSRQAITAVRRGEIYPNLFPDLPRSIGTTCTRCVHWIAGGNCGLDFPEPQHEGPRFAAQCSAFTDRQRKQ
jgi:hypothetical protein